MGAGSTLSARARRSSASSDSPEGGFFWRFIREAEESFPLRDGDGAVGRSTPRVCTPPLRALTPETSAGYSVVEFARDVVGMPLLPWQQEVLIRALELDETGRRFRFRTVLLLVGRQNGKSTLAQALTLWAMYVLGVRLTIGTAQDLDISEELWAGCVDIAESVPVLADEIKNVVKVNGKKSLDLVDGARYKVKASNRKGGRGLSADLILMDELREHTSWDAWGAISKTAMARPKAQTWCLSNAGDDSSVVLMTLRKKAHASLGDPDGINEDSDITSGVKVGSLGMFEYSAAPGRATSDRAGWREANPSLGYTIAEETLAAAEETDPEAVFRTECLCQWVTTMTEGPFANGAWDLCSDPAGVIPDDAGVSYAVDVSWDRSAAYVAVCGRRADGRFQVEVAAARAGQGWIDWVPQWFARFVDGEHPARVVVQSKHPPCAALLEPLSEVEGLTVVEWTGADISVGCGLLYDQVMAADPETDSEGVLALAHRSQEALNLAAHTAAQRFHGDGWYWDRRNSPQDASPLVAATAALWDQMVNGEPAVSVWDDEPLPLY